MLERVSEQHKRIFWVSVLSLLTVAVMGTMTALTHPLYNPWTVGVYRFIGELAAVWVVGTLIVGSVAWFRQYRDRAD